MLLRLLIITLLVGSVFAVAQAQGRILTPVTTTSETKEERDPFNNSPLEQMRARMAARSAEKSHRENVERAREAARLGAELKATFTVAQILNDVDRKKVERVEKLVRKIRSDADGSDGDLDPVIPTDLSDAISKLAEGTDELKSLVEGTPKLVISATVVEQTNQLIKLVKFVRGLVR
ncbi:MAG: hypothetical protein ABIP75_14015 [Pyrinomonadaceae bacterium]